MTILILYFGGNLPTKMYEIVKLVGLLTEIEIAESKNKPTTLKNNKWLVGYE